MATLESKPRTRPALVAVVDGGPLGSSRSTIGRIWKDFGLKPHRADTFKLSTDPLFVEKVVDVVGLYHHPPERAVVLCADEKAQVQALDRSQPVLPMMPGMPERRSHDYVRRGTTTVFAAFDIADGTVISELHRNHRAAEFKKFLSTIDKTVPEGLDIHVICDNYGTHKTPVIKAWLARHPRVHLHFTPTGSSWINQVERWFGFLTDQMIRRGVHKSVQALEHDIRAWIKERGTKTRNRLYGRRPPKKSWTPSHDFVGGFPTLQPCRCSARDLIGRAAEVGRCCAERVDAMARGPGRRRRARRGGGHGQDPAGRGRRGCRHGDRLPGAHRPRACPVRTRCPTGRSSRPSSGRSARRRCPTRPELAGFGAHLGRLVPGWGDPERPAGGPDDSPMLLAEAVVRLLRLHGRRRGAVLLVLEDLHWADPETLAALDYLGDALRTEPVLCLCHDPARRRTPTSCSNGWSAATRPRSCASGRLAARVESDGGRLPDDADPARRARGLRARPWRRDAVPGRGAARRAWSRRAR